MQQNKYIMNWLIVIIIAAVICGLWGYFSGEDGTRGESAATGAAAGAVGCGAAIFYIVMTVGSILLLIRIVGWLFS